ncbi:PREDICTED: replication protein A 70 kDa DNA-binding subunit B-like [Ipomoea nil]|uniref:replication protein A 70 kDa DNA-binding subunit B-like n=1 Tax=Ipomoea nil TaxID=35883 RepID=UPI000900C58D|nr:PREDICTED: replication protein A 70 kDa DNA-binding subunit B-like [Ipomoea nil]
MSGQFIVGMQLHPQQSTKAIRLRCGVFIHVHIPKDIVPKYKNIFKEGKVYAIRSFLCITNFFKYKTSSYRYLIKFKHDTLVKEYKRVNFPKTMFCFKSFEAILSKQGIDEKVLIDVIGRIVEIYSPLEKTIAGKKSRLIDFVLEDSCKKQIKCTLWDEHVDQVTPYFHSVANDPVIVLIQLCRPKFMDNGEVRICSSFGATQLFFSHSCKEFRELRSSYNSDHTPLRCIDSESRLSDTYLGRAARANDVLITSIQDIYSKKQLGEYWVAGRIVDVESLSDWHYISCKSNSCRRKVAADGGMMYCGGCKSSWHEGVVRYRVIIRVADQTGDAPMLLWDRECAELVGVLAGDLKAKYPKGNKCIPPELGCLRDMSMLFRVAMKKEQNRELLFFFHSPKDL